VTLVVSVTGIVASMPIGHRGWHWGGRSTIPLIRVFFHRVHRILARPCR